MSRFEQAIIGAMILGLVLPMVTHWVEIQQILAEGIPPLEEMAVLMVCLFGSWKGAVAGGIIGACVDPKTLS